jgi:hypothetical protein
MKVRFIGGTAAGKEVVFPHDMPFVRMPIYQELSDSMSIEIEEYKIEVLKFGDSREQKYGINPKISIMDAFTDMWIKYSAAERK